MLVFANLNPDELRKLFCVKLKRTDKPDHVDMAIQLVLAGERPPAAGAPPVPILGALPSVQSAAAPEAKTGSLEGGLMALAAKFGVVYSGEDVRKWGVAAQEEIDAAEARYGIPAKAVKTLCGGRFPRVAELLRSRSAGQQQIVELGDSVSITIEGNTPKRPVVQSVGDVSRALTVAESVWSHCAPYLASDVVKLRACVLEEFDRLLSPVGLAELVHLVVNWNLEHKSPLYSMTDPILNCRVQALSQEYGIRCHKCNRTGHMAPDCPLSIAAKPQFVWPGRQPRGFQRSGDGQAPPNGRQRSQRSLQDAPLVDAANICKAFNSAAGCTDKQCKMEHVCSFHRRHNHPVSVCRDAKRKN